MDNASTDGSADAVRERRSRRRGSSRTRRRTSGFARAYNRGWRATSAPLVLFLNPDAEVRPGAGRDPRWSSWRRGPTVGIVGPRTVDADGTAAGLVRPRPRPRSREWRQRRLVRGVAGRTRGPRPGRGAPLGEHEPVWVSGSCLLARRALLEAVGGLRRGLLPLRGGRRPVRARAARRLPRALHARGRGPAPPGPQHGARLPGRARLEYHRSHLLYYRKHNGPLLTGPAARARSRLRGCLGPSSAAGTRGRWMRFSAPSRVAAFVLRLGRAKTFMLLSEVT